MCDSFFVGPIRFPSCFMFMVLSFLSFCFPCIRRSSLARLFLFNFLLGLYRSYVFSNTYAWAEACTVNQFSMIQKMYLLSEIVTNSMLLLSARLQSNGYANINRYHIIQLMGGKCLVIPLFLLLLFYLSIFFLCMPLSYGSTTIAVVITTGIRSYWLWIENLLPRFDM